MISFYLFMLLLDIDILVGKVKWQFYFNIQTYEYDGNLKRVLETTFEENDKYAEECSKQEQQIRDKEKRIVQLEQKIYDQDIASNENLLRVKIDLLAVSNEKKNLEESLAANISEKNQLEL